VRGGGSKRRKKRRKIPYTNIGGDPTEKKCQKNEGGGGQMTCRNEKKRLPPYEGAGSTFKWRKIQLQRVQREMKHSANGFSQKGNGESKSVIITFSLIIKESPKCRDQSTKRFPEKEKPFLRVMSQLCRGKKKSQEQKKNKRREEEVKHLTKNWVL